MVVIGAGAAGLAAAIEASREGASCLVVEAFPKEGGAAATAGGGCCIVGSPLQQAAGIDDSVELALADWLAIGGPDADPVWARYYLEHSREDVYQWAESLGVRWSRLEHYEGNSVPRMHFPAGGGAELVDRLVGRARELHVRFAFSARAVELLRWEGGAAGVLVTSGGGLERVEAPAVVVASGGFCNDHARLVRLLGPWPPPERLLCGGALQAKGLGHDLLGQVGAAFTCLDHVFIYATGTPDPDDPEHLRGLTVRTPSGGIVVNTAGRRIYDEGRLGFVASAQALLAQRPRTSRLVFDSTSAAELELGEPGYRIGATPLRDRVQHFLTQSPYVHRASDLDELAVKAGVEAAGLFRTVSTFNRWVEARVSVDPEFGRDLTGARTITAPPFYAVEFYPLARKSLGGVLTDMRCRVLDGAGSVIPGLYAAGEVAGMAGGHINGAAGLEGTMVAPSMMAGRIAGRTAARERAARATAG